MKRIEPWDLLPRRNGEVFIRGDVNGYVATLERQGRRWFAHFPKGGGYGFCDTRERALEGVASHLNRVGITYGR